MRTVATSLALIAASSCLVASCANTAPIAETPAPPSPTLLALPVAQPSASAEEAREARERDVIRALSPRLPPGVEGMRLAGTGTGFFFASDRVLTNFHVVGNGCRALTVGNNTEGEEVDAKLIARDPGADLAVLSAEAKDIQPARFLTGPFTESRVDLAIVGYPEHGLPVLQAEMNRIAVFQDDLETGEALYRFFGPVRRGNSGGPLLDSSGAVVGIVTAKINTVALYQKTGEVVDDVGFAIPNRTVLNFLGANQIAFEPTIAQTILSSEELLHKAHGFVRQVGCWK